MKWCQRPKRLTAYDAYCGAWVCRCGAILISPPGGAGEVRCVCCGLRFLYDHWAPKPWPKHEHGEGGQALVESAIAIPVLVLIILGGLALGAMLANRSALEYGARSAATRAAAHPGEEYLICQQATEDLRLLFGDPSGVSCQASWDDDQVQVDLEYHIADLPIFGDVIIRGEAVVPR